MTAFFASPEKNVLEKYFLSPTVLPASIGLSDFCDAAARSLFRNLDAMGHPFLDFLNMGNNADQPMTIFRRINPFVHRQLKEAAAQ